MASDSITVKKHWDSPQASDWMLANPWLWLAIGLVFTLWSWLWTVTFGDRASDLRVIVLAVGLLFGGVGVWLRWSNRQILFFAAFRAPIALFLGLIFAVLTLGVTVAFVMSFFSWDEYGLKSAPLFLVWISTAPVCLFACRRCLQRDDDERSALEEETGLAFVVLAGTCLLGSMTFYVDLLPTDWDSMRLFLRAMTAVCLMAAALTLVSTAVRRLTVSLLFLLHFIGINTAALSAPPAPWIVQQTWMRCFRPYLEFVYLNNAYHFYAPEPGPPSYVWFRLIYQSPNGEQTDGMWFKLPGLDEKGNIQHPAALEYQRFLCLTEAVSHPGPQPPENSSFYSNRLALQPNQAFEFGKPLVSQLRIPLHPALPWGQQVFVPSDGSAKLLSSYARAVANKFPKHPDADKDPDKANWTFKSVKIYRVVHWIPPVQWFLNEIPPTDPELYRPFYVGNYDKNGNRMDELDPYLFWLLPSIRDDQNDPDSQIRDYARLHAGDKRWVRRASDHEWVEPKDANQQQPAPPVMPGGNIGR